MSRRAEDGTPTPKGVLALRTVALANWNVADALRVAGLGASPGLYNLVD